MAQSTHRAFSLIVDDEQEGLCVCNKRVPDYFFPSARNNKSSPPLKKKKAGAGRWISGQISLANTPCMCERGGFSKPNHSNVSQQATDNGKQLHITVNYALNQKETKSDFLPVEQERKKQHRNRGGCFANLLCFC